ncbi:MAG: sulfide/dihydroorotate dehydrogenase-like FAD/NAD-binding protein [Candidatus Kaelpia aquatica]|nr:sulfide/dihydroorotate dehydrogenase-like FAD/NAD-binding protein [Candidatus Kaelpia aquatica]
MKILAKEILSDFEGIRITRIEVEAVDLAQKALAGNFVVLMVKEESERIPLTVVDADRARGTITLIFQEIGFSTKLLGKLNVGDYLYSVMGPLGHATEIKNYGSVILVAGGVGIAEIYPVAKTLKEAGNKVKVIIGARTKELLILEDELREVSDALFVTTDDGSYSIKGFTTGVLREFLDKERVDIVYAVGPIPMMEKVADVTKGYEVKTLVSLNSLMVDASGMCGGCRVNINGEVKFACVDGPEFDAHHVDWSTLKTRNNVYADKEKHICNLNRL